MFREQWFAETCFAETCGTQRYKGVKKPPMPEEQSHKVVPSLALLAAQQVSIQRVAKLDLHFLKKVMGEETCPEFGGV